MAKLTALNKKDNDLYKKIINLPFVTSVEKFDSVIEAFEDSESPSENEKEYLQLKLQTKNKWAKCKTKTSFRGGVSTTSRIEGLHGVLRRYLNSTSSLQKVFFSFREIELTTISKFHDEFNRHSKQQIISANPLKAIEESHSKYV